MAHMSEHSTPLSQHGTRVNTAHSWVVMPHMSEHSTQLSQNGAQLSKVTNVVHIKSTFQQSLLTFQGFAKKKYNFISQDRIMAWEYAWKYGQMLKNFYKMESTWCKVYV